MLHVEARTIRARIAAPLERRALRDTTRASRGAADRRRADRPAGRVQCGSRRALPHVVSGHEPAVLHGRGGGPGDPGGGVLRPSPGPVRPGSRRSLHPRRQLSAVPDRMESARRDTRGWRRARLRSRQRAWSDRDLGVLVVAQRALRPACGQAAHGASGRGGRLWRPGWRRRRGARDGAHVTRERSSFCWDCRAPSAWRGPLVIGRGMPARRARAARCKRRDGADGPRSGACHCFEISRSWSRSPRRLPR